MLHLKMQFLLLFLAVCYFIVMFTSTSDAIVSRRWDIGKLNNNNNNIHHRLNIYDNRRREQEWSSMESSSNEFWDEIEMRFGH